MRISDWSSDVCSSDLFAERCGSPAQCVENMSFISLWSAIASALLMPVSPPNAAHTQILPHHSQPTIAAEPIALPMTASRPAFIIADQPAQPAPTSPAPTLNGHVHDISTI